MWGEQAKWNCHPLKSLGPRTWLVVSPTPPPDHIMMFNATPLIVKEIQKPNQKHSAGVIAGPLSKPTSNTNTEQQMPFMQEPPDAWAAYRQKHQMAPPSSAPSTSAASSTATGPTTQHLQFQDNKIQHLEQEFGQLKQEVQAALKQQDTKLSQGSCILLRQTL